MHINADGFFVITETGKVMSVHASQKRGRWQYRHDGKTGTLIASGGTPAKFVRQFWLRDDYAELEAYRATPRPEWLD